MKLLKYKQITAVILLCTVIMLSGCGNAKINDADINNTSTNANNVSTNVNNEESPDIYLFEEYIAGYDKFISKDRMEVLRKKYDEIVNLYKNKNINQDEYYKKLDEFDSLLRKNNIDIPYASLESFLDGIKELESKDRKYLLENQNIIFAQDSKEVSEAEYNKYLENAKKIMNKYGINFEEVLEQFNNTNYQYALFDVSNGNIKYIEQDANIKDLTKEQKNMYTKIIKKIKTFIPDELWKQLSIIEFNTDGEGNVLAHTVPEGQEGKTFRLALDINDTVDSKGNMKKDGIETVIHEFGHVITLNTKQMKNIEYMGTDDVPFTDKYEKDAYIMKFYNKFWQNIYEESKKPESKEYEGEYSKFYNKYKEQFVSDYASTNPEEDIAESFRIFVISDKPKGNSIADKKVLFFYQFDKFIKYREIIRKNLKLD